METRSLQYVIKENDMQLALMRKGQERLKKSANVTYERAQGVAQANLIHLIFVNGYL